MAAILTVLMNAAAAGDWEAYQGLLWEQANQCGDYISPTITGYSLSHCQQACQEMSKCTAVNYGNYHSAGQCDFLACPCGKHMKPASKTAQTSTGCILTR
jgi:hypothetical protein